MLTVTEVEGLSDCMDELSDEELPSAGPTSKQLPAHPSVVMVSGKTFYLDSPRIRPGTHMYMLAWLSCLVSVSLFSQSAHTSDSSASCFGSVSVLAVC